MIICSEASIMGLKSFDIVLQVERFLFEIDIIPSGHPPSSLCARGVVLPKSHSNYLYLRRYRYGYADHLK